jgi:hypothetical protein
LTLTGSDTVSQLETGNTINATFARTGRTTKNPRL